MEVDFMINIWGFPFELYFEETLNEDTKVIYSDDKLKISLKKSEFHNQILRNYLT